MNQWQENVIRLERYVFAKEEYRCVVTGSSMASRIRQDLLSANDYNLSASGRSAFVGIETILRRPAKPKCVVIEANWTLLQNPDGEEVHRVFAPVSFFFKSRFSAFREMNQPVAVLAAWLKGSKPMIKPDVIDVNFKEHFMAQKALEARIPTSERMEVMTDRLTHLTRTLRENGIRVFFFDPPRERDLINGPRTRAIRDAIQERIPDAEWLEFEEGTYTTEDGTHLTTSSAERFTVALKHCLQGIR